MIQTEAQMCLLEAAILCQEIDRLEHDIHIATDDEHLVESIFYKTNEEQEATLFLSKLMQYSDTVDQNIALQLHYDVCLDDTIKRHCTTVKRRHDYLTHQLNQRPHWKVQADRFRVEVAMECMNATSLDSLLADDSMEMCPQSPPTTDLGEPQNMNKDVQRCLLHSHFWEAATLYQEINRLEHDIRLGTDDEYLAESILRKSNQERESMRFLEELTPHSDKLNQNVLDQNIGLQLEYDACLDQIMKGHFKTVKRRHDFLVDQLNRRPQWKLQADRFRAEAAMDCMNIMRAPSMDSLFGDDSLVHEAEMELFNEPIMCPPSPTVFSTDNCRVHQYLAGDTQAVVSPEGYNVAHDDLGEILQVWTN